MKHIQQRKSQKGEMHQEENILKIKYYPNKRNFTLDSLLKKGDKK